MPPINDWTGVKVATANQVNYHGLPSKTAAQAGSKCWFASREKMRVGGSLNAAVRGAKCGEAGEKHGLK